MISFFLKCFALVVRALQIGPIERVSFELVNLKSTISKSFNETNQRANLAMEISSEGEWQQMLPIAQQILANGGKLEILFASSSVAKALEKWATENAPSVRLARLPLLTRSWPGQITVERWLSASVLCFCRYDFYPDLLKWGQGPGRELWLFNATLKNRVQWWHLPFKKCFDRGLFSCFSQVYLSSSQDKIRWQQLYPEDLNRPRVAEFRSQFIESRVAKAKSKLGLAPWSEQLSHFLGDCPTDHVLILGNVWPNEMTILAGSSLKNFFKNGGRVIIVPHLVDGENADFFSGKELAQYLPEGVEVQELLGAVKPRAQVLVALVKGYLVEFYTLGSHAFVGGGHGRSVHSVLEPFIAGCKVYCGPKTYRSTEWDQISSWDPKRCSIVEDLDQFPGLGPVGSVDRGQEAMRLEIANSKKMLLDIGMKLSKNNK